MPTPLAKNRTLAGTGSGIFFPIRPPFPASRPKGTIMFIVDMLDRLRINGLAARKQYGRTGSDRQSVQYWKLMNDSDLKWLTLQRFPRYGLGQK